MQSGAPAKTMQNICQGPGCTVVTSTPGSELRRCKECMSVYYCSQVLWSSLSAWAFSPFPDGSCGVYYCSQVRARALYAFSSSELF